MLKIREFHTLSPIIALFCCGFSLALQIHAESCPGQLITGLTTAPVSLELHNANAKPAQLVVQSLDKMGVPIDGGATFDFGAGESRDLHVGQWNPAAQALCLVGGGITGKVVLGVAREVEQSLAVDAEGPFVAPVFHGRQSTEITIANRSLNTVTPDLSLRDQNGNEILHNELLPMLPSESETLDLSSLVPDSILAAASSATFGPPRIVVGVDLPRQDGRLLVRYGTFNSASNEFAFGGESAQIVLKALVYNPTPVTVTIRYELIDELGAVREGSAEVRSNGAADVLEGVSSSVRTVTMHSSSPFGAMVVAAPLDPS